MAPLSDAPALAAARPGSAAPIAAGGAFTRNPLAVLGLVIVVAAPADRRALRRRCSPPYSPDRAETCARSGCCRRAPRIGSAPTSSAATSSRRIVYGARITLVDRRCSSPSSSAPIGLAGRHRRRLSRRLGRHGADAHHRHLPRLPAADPGARLRRGARARHRERHHRHRASPPGRPMRASRGPRR